MPALHLLRFLLCAAVFAVVGVVTATDPAVARQALTQEGASGLHRRVLTLPGAVVRDRPAEQAAAVVAQVSAFTVYYVFAQRDGWLEVGPRPNGQPLGWLKADRAEDWKTMLVMEYAPAGQRGRVPFFQGREPLAALVGDRDRPDTFGRLREGIDAGHPDNTVLAAVEPAAVVDRRTRPYLMPILDWHWAEFSGGTETTLVQVGGLNADTRPAENPAAPQADLDDFRIGLVFVLDTTLSMGPYIDRTYATVETVYKELERSGALDRVAFGMVGYRDHVGGGPGIEYVTRVYQNLSPDTPPETILKNLKQVTPVGVSTDGWDEDAFAGLQVAINDLNWEPFDARIIVLVTDAGARSATDPNVTYPGIDERVLADAATRRGITIFPIHLRTAEAARLGDLSGAERVYRALGRTGDSNTDKYLGVDGGSVEDFGKMIGQAVAGLHGTIQDASGNRLPAPAPVREGDMASLLVNEVFRAQLEYIGRASGTQAPAFYRAWAADRDLADPRLAALRVSVFLNRTQFSALARSLRAIVERARAADIDPGGFFDGLQGLAATMATDANQAAGQGDAAFTELAASGLLPEFLSALPYHSKVLMLTREMWLDWGLTGQQEFILELDSKIAIYDALDRDTANWVDLGSGEPGLAVYPLPLEQLP